jgi:ribosomal protein L18E
VNPKERPRFRNNGKKVDFHSNNTSKGAGKPKISNPNINYPVETLLLKQSSNRPVVSNPHPPGYHEESVRDRNSRNAEERELREAEERKRAEEEALELAQLQQEFYDKSREEKQHAKMEKQIRDRLKREESDRREKTLSRAISSARDKARHSQTDAWSRLLESEAQNRSKVRDNNN